MSIDKFGDVPEPHVLQQRCRALALLDAICNTDRNPDTIRFRHDETSFPNHIVSHYREETGNNYTIVFGPPGVIIHGFDCDYRRDLDHPAAPTPVHVVDRAPAPLLSMLPTPVTSANFCLWRTTGDLAWRSSEDRGPDDDDEAVAVLWPTVSNDLDSIRAQVFEDYYVTLLAPDLTADLLTGHPISPSLIRALNPRVGANAVIAAARHMGAATTSSASIRTHHPVCESAMVDAVIRRDYGRLLILLSSQRFSIDVPDPLGRTAVHWTVILGETAMLTDLLATGADPNRADLAGRTPLAVLRRGDRAAAELLLAAGADPDSADKSARTPRDRASGPVLATINQLAPAATRTRVEGRVIDHPVGVPIIDAICTGNTQWLRDELAAGVDPDTTTTTGWTALMWAAHLDHPTHARILLDAGADPNRRDTFGNNALTAAIFGPSPAVMRVLLDRGADPHATNDYGTSPADTVARLVRQDYKDLFAEAGCRR